MAIIRPPRRKKKKSKKKVGHMPDGLKKWRKRDKKRYVSMLKRIGVSHCYFYVVKLRGKDEAFVKVGISVNPEKRLKHIPYSVKILVKHRMEVNNAYNFESAMIRMLYHKNLLYRPIIDFAGRTECFKTAALLVMKKSFINNNIKRID